MHGLQPEYFDSPIQLPQSGLDILVRNDSAPTAKRFPRNPSRFEERALLPPFGTLNHVH